MDAFAQLKTTLIISGFLCVLAQAAVNITILQRAVEDGAVCLDGSPPAYYFLKGSSRNWLIFMPGGAWCYGTSQERSCLTRSATELGSSTLMDRQLSLNFGIFSSDQHSNPDFWNWNKVWIGYCDGGSFSGNVAHPVAVSSSSNKTRHLYYRGLRIWKYVVKDLLQKGMQHAQKALLSGCSAGGVATALLCDEFKSLMPPAASVKCFSDAGFMLDLQDITGKYELRSIFQRVVEEHGISIGVRSKYIPRDASYQQLFPQYILPFVQAPFFLLNPAYDTWQIRNVLLYPTGEWRHCVEDYASCSRVQLDILQGFRARFLEIVGPAVERSGWGSFIDSCFHHCQGDVSAVRVWNQSILEALGDWFMERKAVKLIESKPWPGNPTCVTYFEDRWL